MTAGDKPGALGFAWFGNVLGDGDTASAQKVEEFGLRRREAVEADEADFRRQSENLGRRAAEARFELAQAEPALRGTFAIELLCPMTKTLGVARIPGMAARGMRAEGRQQRPGFHGEGGHGLGRKDREGILALHAGPQRAFLKRRKQQRSVGRGEGVVLPQVAQPGIPVEDGGRRPHLVAGGSLFTSMIQAQRASGAWAGGHHRGPATERIHHPGEPVHRGFRFMRNGARERHRKANRSQRGMHHSAGAPHARGRRAALLCRCRKGAF